MFRRLGALLAVMLTVMVGCHPQTPRVQPNTAEFTCDIRAAYKELAVAGSLTRHSAGTLELKFTEPSTLDGLTAVWDGETVTMHLYGLSFTADPTSIPESGLGQELVAVLDAALRGEGEREIGEGGTVVLTGETAAGAYTLVCDGNSGYPLSLSVPALPLSAEFNYS